MIASFTGDENSYTNFVNSFNKFSTTLNNSSLPSCTYSFDSSKINEGLIIPSDVQYVVKGGELNKSGYDQNGKLDVLKNILQSDYLWNNIRVQGGAYGAYMADNDGDILLYSYRDPNLKTTIDTFNKIPEYLKNFDADAKQMTDYIVGTIGQFDNSFDNSTPFAISDTADYMYFTNTTQSDLQKEKEDILSTSKEDIKNSAPLMDAILKQNYICVVGGKAQIEQNKDDFINIKDMSTFEEEKGQITTIDKKDNVPANKVWTINFARDINPATVNTANVFVLNNQNDRLKSMYPMTAVANQSK